MVDYCSPMYSSIVALIPHMSVSGEGDKFSGDSIINSEPITENHE